MIAMTLAEIAAAVGGRLAHGGGHRSPAVASSTPAPAEAGGLFVAFAGERVDGHDYAAGASRPARWRCSAPAPGGAHRGRRRRPRRDGGAGPRTSSTGCPSSP